MKFKQLILSFSSALFLLCFSFSSVAEEYSNEWRIYFDGKASEDGSYTLTFREKGGEPLTAVIKIDKGTRENQAARITRRQLDGEVKGYDVDKEDGEEVQFRNRMRGEEFSLEIDDSNLKGLDVKLRKKRF
ncbi:hypothetical protein FE810_10635 [Thalassotalea litorea]|uniref:Uncharacterized protein n=1 Tax=Thalassotalea litorea TaxID=2020715 RepID=A0A5R9IJX4_9GAMM|nr:hypothetical protein [Thalassotalea litorea]TLU64899.1 hypothetical protein FE810_10635 [Thalassotalea litorea]